MRRTILFEETDTGWSAHVSDLPGCVAAGYSLTETAYLMETAIRNHLEGIRDTLYDLADKLPESDIPAAERYLEFLIALRGCK